MPSRRKSQRWLAADGSWHDQNLLAAAPLALPQPWHRSNFVEKFLSFSLAFLEFRPSVFCVSSPRSMGHCISAGAAFSGPFRKGSGLGAGRAGAELGEHGPAPLRRTRETALQSGFRHRLPLVFGGGELQCPVHDSRSSVASLSLGCLSRVLPPLLARPRQMAETMNSTAPATM